MSKFKSMLEKLLHIGILENAEMQWKSTLFIGTILISRLWLLIMRKLIFKINFINSSPTIKGFKIHHYMYGIIMVTTGFVLKSEYLIAIGMGLFIDEVIPLIKYGNNFNEKQYWSLHTYIWTLVVVLLCVGKV